MLRTPDWKTHVRRRLAGLNLTPAREAEIVEEVSQHLQDRYRDLRSGGRDDRTALKEALAELDHHHLTRELARVERSEPLHLPTLGDSSSGLFTDAGKDLHFALRTLRKSPGFAAIVVFTLALGIGANTALFSVVNGVLLNPLPFPQPHQLVVLHESKPNFETGAIPYPNFLDWQRDNHTFASMAVFRGTSFSLIGWGEAENVRGEYVTADLFPLLGVRPVLGRAFTADEDRFSGPPAALVSAGLWRRKLSARSDILGQSLALDGRDYMIVGVMPESLDFVSSFSSVDVYVPMAQWSAPGLRSRSAGLGIHGVGRLKPGVTIEQARADLATITSNLAAAYPAANKGVGATIVPLKQTIVGDVQPFLLVLLGAVGFVLLIACLNVANLLLARSTGRSREVAIRVALGARRGRIVRQLLTESLVLSCTGGALGLLLAAWGTRAALGVLPTTLPRAAGIGLDARVFAFTTLISLVGGVLFGLMPAIKASTPALHDALKEGGRGSSGRHRAQGALVVAEMAMALVLLVGAGLMIRSLVRVWSVDPGFDPRGVLTFGLKFPPMTADPSPDAARSTLREIDRTLASVPGVRTASLSWGAFPIVGEDDRLFWLEGEPKPTGFSDMKMALSYVVEPDYLDTMGIALKRGRFFTVHDDERASLVLVVDEVFAHQFFGNMDPIGRRVYLQDFDQPAQIVGVVRHVRQWGLDRDDAETLRAQMYLPLMQLIGEAPFAIRAGTRVIARAEGAPASIFEPIRHAVQTMNSQFVLFGARTMDQVIASSFAARRFALILLGTFATLALLLASVGIYGVISYLVGQRTHEIGVRIALGARRGDVLRWVLGHGAKLVVVGVALGALAAIGLTRVLARYSMLFGVSATDPATFSAVAVLLTLVALAACFVPAIRATRADPLAALRQE
jgi:predicted permease